MNSARGKSKRNLSSNLESSLHSQFMWAKQNVAWNCWNPPNTLFDWLEGKQIATTGNLQPKRICGDQSNLMILAAKEEAAKIFPRSFTADQVENQTK